MNRHYVVAFLSAVSLLCAGGALAQERSTKGEFEPYVGQPGKDVVWVPTPESVVNGMLDLAKLTPNDFLVDLGSGDGRTVITAGKRGTRAMGVEFNPEMVAISNREAARQGVSDKVKFVNGDIFATDFSQATVLTMYLLPSLNIKLRPMILDMKPGTRVVSHAFNMGEWEPDNRANPEGRQIYLWIVPAKVGGNWTLQFAGQQGELDLQQSFQTIQGSLRAGAQNQSLFDARLRGDEIRFTVLDNGNVRRDFSGRVQGNSITGSVKTAGQPGEASWSATRR